MSTASVVPETWELTGDDAKWTLRQSRVRRVTVDAVKRFRWADGFSHSRALAFQIVLSIIPGALVAVGAAALAHNSALSRTITDTMAALVPGPTGEVFKQAATQGAGAASPGQTNLAALLTGGLALTLSGCTAFGQVERGANRIYGVEKDRPAVRKYGVGMALTASAGVLLTISFVLLATGRAVADSLRNDTVRLAWLIGRWPLGIVVLASAYAVVFRVCPKRRQPSLSWLLVGGLIAVALNVASSLVLSGYLTVSGSFGTTYGPLAGFLGLMIWAYLVSIGLFIGLAFAAQLEAVRAGYATPQSTAKVAMSEPATTVEAERADAERAEAERIEAERAEAERDGTEPPVGSRS